MVPLIPLEHTLFIAAALFVIGLGGVLARRNLIFVLLGIEIMLNAVGLAFIGAGARWGQPDGQIMYILVITLAATEASIGLALILKVERQLETMDIDALGRMRG